MPTLRYALEKGETRRLAISWKSAWRIKDVTIFLDGRKIGAIADRKELEAGQQLSLGVDTLKVQLAGKKLLAFRNGQPLVADPTPQLRLVYGVIFFIAILTIVVGLVAELFQVEWLEQWGSYYVSVIIGGVFLTLGFFVRRRSRLALGIAVGLYTLDTAMLLIIGISSGNFPLMGLWWHIIFLIIMFRGFRAIRELKEGW